MVAVGIEVITTVGLAISVIILPVKAGRARVDNGLVTRRRGTGVAPLDATGATASGATASGASTAAGIAHVSYAVTVSISLISVRLGGAVVDVRADAIVVAFTRCVINQSRFTR